MSTPALSSSIFQVFEELQAICLAVANKRGNAHGHPVHLISLARQCLIMSWPGCIARLL
jgi:hypothetical protein